MSGYRPQDYAKSPWWTRETAGESRKRRYTYKPCKSCGDYLTARGMACARCVHKEETRLKGRLGQ
jgi:uncharacterized OB-fold protein